MTLNGLANYCEQLTINILVFHSYLVKNLMKTRTYIINAVNKD